MPQVSTRQSHMDIGLGKYPEVDANGILDDLSFKVHTITKTTDYTVLASESGAVFLTTGATGGVNFTLPASTDGLWYVFICAHDEEMMVTADTADTLVAFNDIAADSIAYTTASEHVGNGFILIADGTKWHALCLPGQDSATVTIAS